MQKRLLLLFLLASSAKLFAQIGFEENIVAGESYTTRMPRFVKAVDVDDDTDLDIITYGNGLNWYENIDGLGNFGERKVIATTANAPLGKILYTFDIDNDGDLDILISYFNKYTLYKNTDGLGNYVAVQDITLGINSTGLFVTPSDIDGDSDIDILCYYTISGSSPNKLVWFENNGLGAFAEEQIISTSSTSLYATSFLNTDDLDGDNDEDIIIGYSGLNKIAWLKNIDGNGVFSLPITISTLAGGLSNIKTSDIDNDGDMDIVSASANDNQVAWYKNLDGLGTFSDENIITSNAIASKSVFVDNINNDSTKDIVYTSTNEIGWLSNSDGLGNFTNQQIITTKAFGVQDVIMADLDGDGKNDIISASMDDDKVAWYKNLDGNGNFDRQVIIARSIEFPYNIYPGDFDGDADIDLLVNSQHDAKITWIENVNGVGFYGKEHIVTENVNVGNLIPIAYPADIDGDGDLDIVAKKNSKLIWFENVDGQGTYTTEHIINNTSSVTLIRSADMDGDGDMDIVCGVYNSDKFSWYKNLDSMGTFSAEMVIADAQGTNGSLTSLEIADMDGDNDMDIIGSSFDWDMFFFKNTNGLGNFALQNMAVFGSMMSVYPADMDGDGDKDIIGVSASGGGTFDAVVWYENSNGQGDFNVPHDISTLTVYGKSIHAADIDNDGDMDVLTAGGHPNVSGMIEWYENNGSGTFSERKIIHERNDYSVGMWVTTADIDYDNDLDVLGIFSSQGNTTLSRVSVFENLGDLGNTIQGIVTIDSDSNGCTSNDIKGSNLMVVSTNGNDSFATFTDQNGAYNVATNEGNFTTSITNLPNYYVSNPTSHVFNFTGMNNTHQADFCVAPIGQINDLDISVYPLQNLRPGFATSYRLVYRNKGTTTLNGTLNFEYNNSKLNFITATQAVSSQTASTLTFDFTNLKPFETKTINLNFTAFSSPTTAINDQVSTVVTISPVLADATEEDNSFTLNQTVIGSYDPNDITCLEGNQVLIGDADKYLHYLIRFQNTGTANAININVENTLDNKLDWTTMQLESMSHNGRVEINNGNDVKFIFTNINLHDSTTDEPNSHGFIAYKIKPLANVVTGDIVNNTANIYFDFNQPITTNTASTQFVDVLSVVENDAAKFNIYPNPTTSLLEIKGNTMIENVSLIDVNGRVLKAFNYENPSLFVQLDLTELTSGIYFLRIKTEQGYTNRKIVKR